MVDERLSSWEAEQTVSANKSIGSLRRARKPGTGRKRRASVDDVAAAVVLRDYLTRAHPQRGMHN